MQSCLPTWVVEAGGVGVGLVVEGVEGVAMQGVWQGVAPATTVTRWSLCA